MIAVRIPVIHRTTTHEILDYHVILNPGDAYVIRGNEELVCIAHSSQEIKQMESLVRKILTLFPLSIILT
jgi:hypothetical protein